MYPEPKRLKRKIDAVKINEIDGIKNAEFDAVNFVHPAQLTKCRAVYAYSPTLQISVRAASAGARRATAPQQTRRQVGDKLSGPPAPGRDGYTP
jgi:hypothetical protein